MIKGEPVIILLAEDDPAHVAAIKRALKASIPDIQVRVAGTLAAFRQAVADCHPDLAIMDLNLSDGCAIEILTSPPEAGPFPILIMASYGSEKVAVEVVKAGALDYMVKSAEIFAAMPHTVERARREWKLLQQRKRAEEEIIREKAFLDQLIESAPESIAITDCQGRVLRVNSEFTRMFGYGIEETIGKRIDALVTFPECQEEAAAITESVAHGNKIVLETVRRRKDGSIFAVSIVGAPINISGRQEAVYAIYRDISESRRVEAERKSMETQLLQAQKMEALGQLAGGVAHDFNNLLTGISGFTQFALEQTPQGSPIREDLTEVLKLAKRAEALTRQLLSFSRRQALPPEVLNINRTVEEMMKTLGRLIGEHIDLVFVLAPDPGNVNVDPGQLEQVLVNLALNARDAMPAGGKLTVETANAFLNHDYAYANFNVTPGEYVMLAVSDTGCGMDENTRQHIFEPFFTSKPQGMGTGLGLSTVYGIVNQFKGAIWVDSKPGQGTTFKIYLPRVVAVAGEKALPTVIMEPLTKGTILIVEDDAAVLQIAQRAIGVCGYRILTAASSSEAEKMLAAHAESIDLILLDVVLPGDNGYQLFESSREKYPHLLVLYMSGYIDNATVNNDILARGLPFIKKPFTAEVLVLKVLETLGEKNHG